MPKVRKESFTWLLGTVRLDMSAPRLATPTKTIALAIAAQALKRSADPRTYESPQEKRLTKKGSDVPPKYEKRPFLSIGGAAGQAWAGGEALVAKFKLTTSVFGPSNAGTKRCAKPGRRGPGQARPLESRGLVGPQPTPS